MTAVILAAGRGTRLGNLTLDIPKALLSIDDKTILRRQLDAISAFREISSTIIVSGFAREKLSPYFGANIVECYNPKWERTNNIVSLAEALNAEAFADGLLLFNSDVVFHPAILKFLIHSKHPCALSVDTVHPADDEQMKIRIDSQEGKIIEISKKIALNKSNGEYIGLAKFCSSGVEVLKKSLNKLLADNRTNEWYESAFQDIFHTIDICPCDTRGLPWIEVDTPIDFAHAKTIVKEI